MFDLDHTLVNSPLDLAAWPEHARSSSSGTVTAAGGPERYRSAISFALLRRGRVSSPVWAIALEHERRAVERAWIEPGALEALTGARAVGFATAL